MKTKKNSMFRGIVLIFAILLSTLSAGAPALAAVTSQSLAVPVFQHPKKGSFWSDVTQAGSTSVPFIVTNPANGPGATTDGAYAEGMAMAADAGIRPLGYVQTNDQARAFNDLYSAVDAWYRLYPRTQGMYVDLLKQRSTADVCYVAALYTRIKSTHPNDLVVLNFSGNVAPTYEPYGDIFVNAESDYESYRDTWKPRYKGFEDNRAYQNRFWHKIYNVKSEDFNVAFSRIRENNAGWAFLTDKVQPTPYNATPSFWQNEANEVRALPPSTVPNRGMTTLPRGCISLGVSADSTVDTTGSKQSKTTSQITVTNTDITYDSPPAAKLELTALPTGVSVAALGGDGWSCDQNTRSCTFNGTLPAKSTAPVITAVLLGGCDTRGNDGKARLTNYAGNHWDITLPVSVPFGCEATSPAGKLNKDSSGQILRSTTQGAETTPAIKLPGATEQKQQPRQMEEKVSGMSAAKIALLILLVLMLAGLSVWSGLLLRRRNRYRIEG